jgi:hypothetical protein
MVELSAISEQREVIISVAGTTDWHSTEKPTNSFRSMKNFNDGRAVKKERVGLTLCKEFMRSMAADLGRSEQDKESTLPIYVARASPTTEQ